MGNRFIAFNEMSSVWAIGSSAKDVTASWLTCSYSVSKQTVLVSNVYAHACVAIYESLACNQVRFFRAWKLLGIPAIALVLELLNPLGLFLPARRRVHLGIEHVQPCKLLVLNGYTRVDI